MKVDMTACDNPHCDEVTADLYGWVYAEVSFVGSGPTDLKVEVCSTACLDDGVTAVVERRHFDELEQNRTHWEQFAATIREQRCPKCEALPGEPCMARTGNIAQEPHSARRKAAHAKLQADREDNPQ